MYYIKIKHSLAFLVAATLAFPLVAQRPNSNVRIDTASTVIRDEHGNIVGTGFYFRADMEGSFEIRRDRLRSQKITFFSNYIQLTSKEAERFWPVYNEYSDKLEQLKTEQRNVLRQLSESERMNNEKELKRLLDAYVNSCVRESAIFQEYYRKFCTILSPLKVVRLYQAEEEFRQSLLRGLRGR
jgi:hypothetical protein